MAQADDMRQALQSVLTDMRQAATALADTLETERLAIASRDSAVLDRTGDHKSALMRQLEQLDLERQQLSCADAAAAQSLDTAWREVLADLRHCHQLNLRNGSAVHQHLAQVRTALSILTGHAGEDGLYGRAGTVHASLRSQVLAEV